MELEPITHTLQGNIQYIRFEMDIFAPGVYIFLLDPPKIWPNDRLGGKNDLKGIKKGGENTDFFPIGKKYVYFFPN